MSIVVLLVSCSQKYSSKEDVSNKREFSSKIGIDLVDMLIGDWLGDEAKSYEVEGYYKILVSNSYVYFNEKEFQITDTKDNVVFTQTKEDNPFYYDFQITDIKLEVLPLYPVPKGSNRGSLMTMRLVREMVSTDSTLQSSSKEVSTSETTEKVIQLRLLLNLSKSHLLNGELSIIKIWISISQSKLMHNI